MFLSFYISTSVSAGLQDTLSKYCVHHTQSQLGTTDCFSQLRNSQLNSIMLSLLYYLFLINYPVSTQFYFRVQFDKFDYEIKHLKQV